MRPCRGRAQLSIVRAYPQGVLIHYANAPMGSTSSVRERSQKACNTIMPSFLNRQLEPRERKTVMTTPLRDAPTCRLLPCT